MTQTKRASFAEAWANVAIGYSINFCANLLILPLFGFDVSLKQNLALGAIYTVISVVRSYYARRFFNWIKWGNNG